MLRIKLAGALKRHASMKNRIRPFKKALRVGAKIFVLALLPSACAAGERGYAVGDEVRVLDTEAHRVAVTVIVDDLKHAWSVAELPDGSLLITEKEGRLHHVNPARGTRRLVEGLPESVKRGQGGLMDVRPHPNFESNRWLYLSYSIALGDAFATRAARAQLENGRLENLQVLFTAEPARESGLSAPTWSSTMPATCTSPRVREAPDR